MSGKRLRLASPEPLVEFIRGGPLRESLAEIASLAGAELDFDESPSASGALPGEGQLPIQYRGRTMGQVTLEGNGNGSSVARAARTLVNLMEYLLDRETTVGDLAEAMIDSYEELNMFYASLSNIATRVFEPEIGEALVEQAARTLGCRRVSLLLLDEAGKNLEVLASCGLPRDVRDISIPVSESIAGRVILGDDLLLVNDVAARPDLARLSRGAYETPSFAVIRVPLKARGEPLGLLTATERSGAVEFTARDRKLLEGLSNIGASALMSSRLHANMNRQMMSTIEALALAVDAKDRYTRDHSGRVARFCVATSRELGITSPAAHRDVRLAGLLHDIGKIGVADAILGKQDGLSPAEWSLIKTHAEIGARIVRQVRGLESVADAILHHHERYDGLGYPSGLSGEAIPVMARLIAVCDTFDSLTSDRPYRAGVGTEEALRVLQASKSTQFDPAVLDAFAAAMQRTPKLFAEERADRPAADACLSGV